MTRSAGVRFFIVGLLALLMFIPLFLAGEVIDSRADYSRQTVDSVGQEWGGIQSLSGPMLVLPVVGPVTRTERREVRNAETGEVEVQTFEVTETGWKAPVHVFPDAFDADLATTTEIRHRGLFRVPVYSAEADIRATFGLAGAEALLSEGERILWAEAEFHLSLTSNRALRGAARLTVDGTEAALEPRAAGGPTGGIFALVGDPRPVQEYRLALGFNGAQSLFLAPVGRDSRVTIASDWPHPSFGGAFLPDGSEVSDDGFSARWTIPHLARALPQIAREDYDQAARNEAFGVRFFQPNDFYQKAYRAARYGILFIALTFLTVLLIENRQGRPAHPVQYILIGLAQSVFVLLMVAYAEQIGFGPAYLLSAGATVALLTMFGALGLGLGRRTLVLAAMLTLLYAVLYLILQSADYALLAGSTLAFFAIAFTMYATRNEDWYGPERPEGQGGLLSGLAGKTPDTPPDAPPDKAG